MIYCLVEDSLDPDPTGASVIEPGPEGLIHCCDERQIHEVRKGYFPPDARVVAIVVDPTRLSSETVTSPAPAVKRSASLTSMAQSRSQQWWK